jgi:hypothetical protein
MGKDAACAARAGDAVLRAAPRSPVARRLRPATVVRAIFERLVKKGRAEVVR